MATAGRDRWDGRPWVARALRMALLVAPVVAAIAVIAAVSFVLGPTPRGASGIGRVAAVMALAMLVAALTERAARRLLPLSILLELTMLFPDRAPSRLAVARRARRGAAADDLLHSGDEDAASAAVRILALMSALAAHDRRTRGHAERVRAFTDLVAIRMNLPRADRDKLRWAALLHDIGKLDVAASLLNKPTKLDVDEWTMIKRHPVEGERLAAPLLPWLGEWGRAIVEHHERFDGGGYPNGLAGQDISPAGRIVGVVDAFETMTAARAYKKAYATRDARAELARNAGSQFDPAVVRAFLSISLPRLLWATGPVSFLVQVPFLRVIQEAGVRVAHVSSSVAATTTAVAGAAAISLPVIVAAGALSIPVSPVAVSASARVSAPGRGAVLKALQAVHPEVRRQSLTASPVAPAPVRTTRRKPRPSPRAVLPAVPQARPGPSAAAPAAAQPVKPATAPAIRSVADKVPAAPRPARAGTVAATLRAKSARTSNPQRPAADPTARPALRAVATPARAPSAPAPAPDAFVTPAPATPVTPVPAVAPKSGQDDDQQEQGDRSGTSDKDMVKDKSRD